MPSSQKNLRTWSETYTWSRGGDEWSDRWGGTEYLWSQILFPRISQFIPAHTILEIAPSFGRCTDYLKNYCDQLVVVDLSPRCIEDCKKRFSTGHLPIVGVALKRAFVDRSDLSLVPSAISCSRMYWRAWLSVKAVRGVVARPRESERRPPLLVSHPCSSVSIRGPKK